jgi:hypothetical protein
VWRRREHGQPDGVAPHAPPHSDPGSTYELLRDEYECVPRGRVEVEAEGEIDTWFLLGRRRAAPI